MDTDHLPSSLPARTATMDEIIRRLDALPPALLERVLGYVSALETTVPKGISGAEMVRRFAGTMTPEEAQEMDAIIEEEFEKVDAPAVCLPPCPA